MTISPSHAGADSLVAPIQPAFLVKRSSNLEHLHRNTWKILTRKAASFEGPQAISPPPDFS